MASARLSTTLWVTARASRKILKSFYFAPAFAKLLGKGIRLVHSIFCFEALASFLKSRERFGIDPLRLKTSFDRRKDRIRLSR